MTIQFKKFTAQWINRDSAVKLGGILVFRGGNIDSVINTILGFTGDYEDIFIAHKEFITEITIKRLKADILNYVKSYKVPSTNIIPDKLPENWSDVSTHWLYNIGIQDIEALVHKGILEHPKFTGRWSAKIDSQRFYSQLWLFDHNTGEHYKKIRLKQV